MRAIVDSKEFKRVIKALKPFTRQENNKMQYIYIEVENGEARFEALDGHRIAVEYVKCVEDESFKAYIRPINLFKTRDKKIIIELIGDKAYISDGEFSFGFKQPEGEWYDTKKMITETESIKPQSRVGINPNHLIDALKNTKPNCHRNEVIIETRDKKSPVIVRDLKDKRNIRYILPMTFPDNEEEG